MTKVNAIRCPKCGDVVFSRARHDYRGCTCGAVAIDGGLDYFRVVGAPDDDMSFMVLTVFATPYELYQDWACELDRFGHYTHQEFVRYANVLVSPKENK